MSFCISHSLYLLVIFNTLFFKKMYIFFCNLWCILKLFAVFISSFIVVMFNFALSCFHVNAIVSARSTCPHYICCNVVPFIFKTFALSLILIWSENPYYLKFMLL